MTLAEQRLIPVVVLDDPVGAVPLARALQRGGVRCAEITLRTTAALPAIAAITAEVEDFAVGAGTVLDPDDVDRAVAAGARFLVTPGLDPDVVSRARQLEVEIVPGVATATEVQAARRLGLRRLKLFPAGILGGLALVDALRGPFPDVAFVPSGGVGVDDAAAYAQHPGVFAVSGSWIAPRALIAEGAFDEIERLAREALALVDGAP